MGELLSNAFDAQFWLRFGFAFAFYWCWGILSKGLFEPLQVYLFRRIFNRGELSFEDIEQLVIEDCREIDDRIRGYFGNAFGIASGIITHRNLSPEDKKRYRQLLDKTYSVTKLLDND